MKLLRLYPEVATRDCASCRVWEYQKDGTIRTARDVDQNGKDVSVPVKRMRSSKVPCETDAGCPKGHYEEPFELNEQFHRSYQHYQECRAVGSFPDDPVVRVTAAAFRRAEDECDRIERMQMAQLLVVGSKVEAMKGMLGG